MAIFQHKSVNLTIFYALYVKILLVICVVCWKIYAVLKNFTQPLVAPVVTNIMSDCERFRYCNNTLKGQINARKYWYLIGKRGPFHNARWIWNYFLKIACRPDREVDRARCIIFQDRNKNETLKLRLWIQQILVKYFRPKKKFQFEICWSTCELPRNYLDIEGSGLTDQKMTTSTFCCYVTSPSQPIYLYTIKLFFILPCSVLHIHHHVRNLVSHLVNVHVHHHVSHLASHLIIFTIMSAILSTSISAIMSATLSTSMSSTYNIISISIINRQSLQ